MSNFVKGDDLRLMNQGRYLQGKTSDITSGGAATYTLFDIAGGEVLITALWGKVTTSITTDSETLNLQCNPTTGDTVVVVTATTLGTTDTLAGDVLGINAVTLAPATSWKVNGHPATFLASTGSIECAVVTSSSNGVVEWYCTWIPLTTGATVSLSAVAPV